MELIFIFNLAFGMDLLGCWAAGSIVHLMMLKNLHLANGNEENVEDENILRVDFEELKMPNLLLGYSILLFKSGLGLNVVVDGGKTPSSDFEKNLLPIGFVDGEENCWFWFWSLIFFNQSIYRFYTISL
jgi:hypothetical protein